MITPNNNDQTLPGTVHRIRATLSLIESMICSFHAAQFDLGPVALRDLQGDLKDLKGPEPNNESPGHTL